MKILCLISFVFFMPFYAFANQTTLQKIKENKIFRVCSESGYMPLEMKTSSGKWLGFDVDMMESFAKSMGVDLVMMDTKWDGIIPSLLSGKCDAIASSMAMTKQRENAVLFSKPYYENQFEIAVKNTPENIKKYTNLSNFDNSSTIIAVKTGSSPDLFLQNTKVFEKAQVLKFDADSDIVGAVLNSKADAFIYDTAYVKLAANHYEGKLYIIPEGFNGTQFGVAFRKRDTELLDVFNAFLEQWKSQGGYSASMKYYFDESKWISLLN